MAGKYHRAAVLFSIVHTRKLGTNEQLATSAFGRRVGHFLTLHMPSEGSYLFNYAQCTVQYALQYFCRGLDDLVCGYCYGHRRSLFMIVVLRQKVFFFSLIVVVAVDHKIHSFIYLKINTQKTNYPPEVDNSPRRRDREASVAEQDS